MNLRGLKIVGEEADNISLYDLALRREEDPHITMRVSAETAALFGMLQKFVKNLGSVDTSSYNAMNKSIADALRTNMSISNYEDWESQLRKDAIAIEMQLHGAPQEDIDKQLTLGSS